MLSDEVQEILNEFRIPQIYKYAHPAPYPEIRVSRKNTHYAKILLEDYSGQISELSAITQYVYHHIAFGHVNREIAETLLGIAIVEMHHLKMLGETILKLGINPRYVAVAGGEKRYWDSSIVFYGVGLCDRLTADIAGEWAAVENYRRHQQIINDPFVKRILERIILDELHHIKMLNKLADKHCKD